MREDSKKALNIFRLLCFLDVSFIVYAIVMWRVLIDTPGAVRQFIPNAIVVALVLIVLTSLSKIVYNTLGYLLKGMGYKD